MALYVNYVTEVHVSAVRQTVCTDTELLEFLLSAIDFQQVCKCLREPARDI